MALNDWGAARPEAHTGLVVWGLYYTVGAPPLIEGVSFGALLGDKAFDVDWLRADLDARGAAAVIPPKANHRDCQESRVGTALIR